MINTDEYLLIQRDKNSFDIARNLRKLRKYIYQREQIPLDYINYPDSILDDLRKLSFLSLRIVSQLEGNVDPKIKQLILPLFEEDDLPFANSEYGDEQ